MRASRLALPLLVSLSMVATSGCAEDERTFHNAGDSDSDTDVDEDVEPYDFEAEAPWYACPEQDSLPDGVRQVTAFDQEWQYYGGGEDRRAVEYEVELPTATHYKQIGLWIKLDCPADGKCDAWDRSASLALTDLPDGETIEIARYITPYGIRMCSYVDITALGSLLHGTRTLTSFVDTWVGPGHADGSGWRTTFRLVYYPLAEPDFPEVINIWGRRNITLGQTGDGATTVDSQIEPVSVAIPADAARVEARVIATGHGFGHTYNCAEFCVLIQHVIVNGTHFEVDTWRDDCEQNPVGPQPGTWEYDRQGWCPGAFALPHIVDITDAVLPGEDNIIDYDIRRAGDKEYVDSSGGDWPYEQISLLLYVHR